MVKTLVQVFSSLIYPKFMLEVLKETLNLLERPFKFKFISLPLSHTTFTWLMFRSSTN